MAVGPPPIALPGTGSAGDFGGDTGDIPIHDATELGALSPAEAAALAEPGVALEEWEKRRILAVLRAIDSGEVASLLDLPAQPDPRDLKRAYFELSKQFHPDRYYGKALGSFGGLLARIFVAVSQFVKTLSDVRTVIGQSQRPRRRRAERYDFAAPIALRCASWGQPAQLETQDVSSGGMFVPTSNPARIGDAVALRIATPGGEPFALVGKVAHCRPPDQAARGGQVPGIGIRVTPRDEADLTCLRALCDAARAAQPSPAAPRSERTPIAGVPRVRFARGTSINPKPSRIIAIDLGTTYTSVAAVVDQRVHVLPWPDGSRAIPSVVAFPGPGKISVGRAAKERQFTDPRHVVPAAKRLLGRRAGDPELAAHLSQVAYDLGEGPDGNLLVQMWGEDLAVAQLCGVLLKGARQAAELALRHEVDRAVLTIPVSFTEERIQLLRRAGKLAQLEIVDVIEEPSAAALANRHAPGFGGIIGIYDFGGGTFDFSVVDVSGGDFRVLTSAGDSWLGGDDLDYAVAEAVSNQFWRVHGVDLRQRAVEWNTLLTQAERAKRDLSQADLTEIVVPEVLRSAAGAQDLKMRLERHKTEPLWGPAIDRSLATCTQALALLGLRPGDLSAIYLSGGSSYIPAVRRALTERFQVPLRVGAPPEHAVVLGAGIHAAQLERHQAPTLPSRL